MTKHVAASALLAALLLLGGCAGQRLALPNVDLRYEGFKPVEEVLPVPTTVVFDPASGTRVTRDWEQLTRSQRLNDLPNIDSEVAVFQRDATGSLRYLGNQVTVSKGNYVVYIDFARSRNQEVVVADKAKGVAKIGVGLRLTAEITTTKNGVNISGIAPIALAYENSALSGRIRAQTIGLIARDTSKYFLTQTSLDRSSVQKSLEAFGAIRVIMDDENTVFQPHLLAFSRVAPGQERAATEIVTSR